MDNPKKDKGLSLGVVDPITILITESVINKMRTVPYHLKKTVKHNLLFAS
ncbi:hypothetical protein HMPREF1234_0765 [Streptococcus pyogenes GA41039]|nr:hypothetical protein HMPREF1234_0765 [Streptococcus pyogenes GA41039]